MKKIIALILICCIGKLSIAQNNTYEGNANTMTNFASSGAPTAYGLTKSYVVNAGIFLDTTSANTVLYVKSYNGSQIMTYSGGVKYWLRYGGGWNQVGGASSDSLLWSQNGTNIFNKSNRNVGIGTSVPYYKLDVNGDVGIYGNIYQNNAFGNGINTFRKITTVGNWNNISSNEAVLTINDSLNNAIFSSNITGGIKVGVGVTPISTFHVNGTGRFLDSIVGKKSLYLDSALSMGNSTAGSGGDLIKGGLRWLHNSGATTNIFLGTSSGNKSTNSGGRNIGIGSNALGTALSTGQGNIALGYQAAQTVGSTSSYNIAIGYQAWNTGTTTTGNNNIFIGQGAGKGFTSQSNRFLVGNYNSGILSADTINSLLYGFEDVAPASSRFTVNAKLIAPYTPSGAGVYVLRIDGSGNITKSDTSTSGGSASTIYNANGRYSTTGERTISQAGYGIGFDSGYFKVRDTATSATGGLYGGNYTLNKSGIDFINYDSLTTSGIYSIGSSIQLYNKDRNNLDTATTLTIDKDLTIKTANVEVARFKGDGSGGFNYKGITFQDGTTSYPYATAFGYGTSSATWAFSQGYSTEAASWAETALGYYPTTYTAAAKTGINTGDRLFSIGNGSSAGSRNNAFTLLKNGKTGINTSTPNSILHVVGSIRGTDSLILSGLATGIPSGAKRLLIGSNGSVYAADTTAGNAGTVTSVATGYGLSGGTITSSGTLIADSSVLMTKGTTQVISGLKYLTGGLINTTNGAASTSALLLTGGPSTAGTTTTDYPLLYMNGGTAPTTWNTNGTYMGWNAVSGFTGNFLDAHLNGGASVFNVDYQGVLRLPATTGQIYVNSPSNSAFITSKGSTSAYAGLFESATSGQMYGVAIAAGNLSTDIALRVSSQGFTNPLLFVLGNGLTGVGTASPDSALTVNTSARIGTNLKVGNALTIAGNGAASQPTTSLTGTWFTGGSATTTKPQLLIEPAGTTSTAWSTNGTGLGVNAASGFTGNLIDAQLAGVSKFKVTSGGLLTVVGNNGATDGAANFNSSNNDLSFNAGYYFRLRATGSNKVILGSDWNGSTTYTYAAGDFISGTTGAATSTLQSSGSFATAYVAKTANYTATSSDHTIHFTSGTSTFTFPTAVGITGRIYVVRNDSGNTLTLATTSSQTIDGAAPGTQATATVKQYQSTGANWISLN